VFKISRLNKQVHVYTKSSKQKYFNGTIDDYSPKELNFLKTKSITTMYNYCYLTYYDYSETDKNYFTPLTFHTCFDKNIKTKQIVPFFLAKALSNYIVKQIESPMKQKDQFFKANLLNAILKLIMRITSQPNIVYISGIHIICSGK